MENNKKFLTIIVILSVLLVGSLGYITYDKLLMNSEDKLKIAQENKIDIFIDDCLKNCKEVAEGKIKTYMFASIGNIMVDSKDIEKIYSWPQFYFEVNKFTKNSQ